METPIIPVGSLVGTSEPKLGIKAVRTGISVGSLNPLGDGIPLWGQITNVPSSDADQYKDALEDWIDKEGTKAKKIGFSQGRMDNLLNYIDNVVDKEKLVESSLEEEKRNCA